MYKRFFIVVTILQFSQIEDKKTRQVLIRREARFNPGLMNETMNEFKSKTFL